MPIDKTLKVKAGGIKNRNVLKRAERIEQLRELEKFQPGTSVLGLPKVRVTKIAMKKKKKAKAEEGAEGAVTPAAGGAKPAAGGAKPAAGAKPAGGACVTPGNRIVPGCAGAALPDAAPHGKARVISEIIGRRHASDIVG